MIVRSMKRGARVYTCVGPYETQGMDTERRRWKVRVYVVGRHRWRGLSVGVCRKGVVETVGERPKEKNECVRWIEC